MKRPAILALAAATAIGGMAPTIPQANAAEAAPARSLDQVRAEALAAMRAGDLQEVGKRGWRGKRANRGRGWRGGRSYRHRRHYRGRGYYRGRNRDGAIAAGVAGLAIGAIVAGAAAESRYSGGRSKRWCSNRFKSYDWRSETYLGYDGRRHACP